MRPARMRPFLIAALLLLLAAPAFAKSYSADRFDVLVRVLPDGTLDVTETVVFRFEDGTFKEVFRAIPLRRTDGIEVVRAEMQGQRLPFGKERGTAEVRYRGNRVRVVWRFTPLENTTREFVLNYRVRGAVRREARADLLGWLATPDEHQYRIASSTIQFELPAPLAESPRIAVRKASAPDVSVAGNVVRITASDIGANGWIDTTLSFPRGAVIDTAPAWQLRAARIAAQSRIWILSAIIVGAAGLVLLIAWRQSYDTPPDDLDWSRGESQQTVLPDTADPAVAGVLSSNGRPALEHAMAALFSLAERGEIEIAELPRGVLGQRDYQITRRGSSAGLTEYERAALEIIFQKQQDQGRSATLSQARGRLSRRFSPFTKAMLHHLLTSGLADASRKEVRDRYNRAALWLLVFGSIGFLPAAALMPQYGGWPMLIPTTVLLLALAAVIFAHTVTPLSNDGVRRASRWREYRKHLNAVARSQRTSAASALQMTLPYAVALGLAGAWSKFMKQQGHATPEWFHALPGGDRYGAFPAFIAAGGAGVGGTGGGVGASAGGGASGAR